MQSSIRGQSAGSRLGNQRVGWTIPNSLVAILLLPPVGIAARRFSLPERILFASTSVGGHAATALLLIL